MKKKRKRKKRELSWAMAYGWTNGLFRTEINFKNNLK